MSAGYQIRRAARLLLLLLTLMALALPASARGKSLAQRKKLASGQFESAEKLRQSLEATPRKERSRQEYARTIEAYHRVYFITPNFNKDDASLFREGELLEASGQLFRNPEDSEKAVERYRFLMAQYPGSTHNVEALYNIGEVYQDDLQDGPKAKAAYEEFLKRHPKHEYSEAARQAIAEIDSPPQHMAARNTVPQKNAGSKSAESRFLNKKEAAQARPAPAVAAAKELHAAPPPKPSAHNAAEEDTAAQPDDGKRVLVAGVREWATPDYTRVEIALDGKVAYQAGRIDSPDRIFFDLSESKLAPGLFGKSIVADDGILKKIRMAQYQPGMTRIVLEVAPESEYTASLAANPSRLIIDLHGKQMAHAQAAKSENKESEPAKLAVTQPAPAQHNAAASGHAPAEAATVAPAAKPKQEVAKDTHADAVASPAQKPAAKKPAASTIATAKTEDTSAPKEKTKPPVATAKVPEEDKPTASDATAKNAATQDAPPNQAKTKAEVVEVKAQKTGRPSGTQLANSTAAKGKGNKVAVNTREASPIADGERTLIRALGLKIGRIVVDAGHGGHDTGTVGPHGLEEKDLVLDVAQRLGALLEHRMGAEVVYTRTDDTFIPLEERTAIANQNQADLFISVHANSSHDASARGVETYYLNFTSSEDALEVAARENAESDKSIHELQDLVKSIALKEKVDESREFAGDVQRAMHSGLSSRGNNMRDRGVKKAPFVVLIGANMPSILAEISFLSNPKDERKLETGDYREKIAESLYRGVAEYVRGLSGVKLASVKAAGN